MTVIIVAIVLVTILVAILASAPGSERFRFPRVVYRYLVRLGRRLPFLYRSGNLRRVAFRRKVLVNLTA